MTPAGRSREYFQDILEEPEVLRDSKCQEIVRKAWDYFQMCYEKKLNYWTQNTKPSRWPQLLAALSYAEVRLNRYLIYMICIKLFSDQSQWKCFASECKQVLNCRGGLFRAYNERFLLNFSRVKSLGFLCN